MLLRKNPGSTFLNLLTIYTHSYCFLSVIAPCCFSVTHKWIFGVHSTYTVWIIIMYPEGKWIAHDLIILIRFCMSLRFEKDLLGSMNWYMDLQTGLALWSFQYNKEIRKRTNNKGQKNHRSQDQHVWKKPLRSLNETINLTLPDPSLNQSLRTTSTHFLNTSRDADSTASLGVCSNGSFNSDTNLSIGATTIDMRYICQVIIFSSWGGFNLGDFKILLDTKTDLRNGSKVIYSTKFLAP